MYYVKSQRYEETSEVNQEIIKLFLWREKVKDMTPWVSYVLETNNDQADPPFSLENLYPEEAGSVCPECGNVGMHEIVVQPGMVRAIPGSGKESGLWKCPLCGTTWENYADANSCCVGMTAWQCDDCGILRSPEIIEDERIGTLEEISSWYSVSEFLSNKLGESGELVFLTETNEWIWGREQNGVTHPVEQDAAIMRICRDLGILEGQDHAWPVSLRK